VTFRRPFMSIDGADAGTHTLYIMRWADGFWGVGFVSLLASVAPGCGASGGTSTGPEVSDGGDWPGSSDAGAGDGRTNLPPGCPERIPRSGDACTLPNGQSCYYGCDRGDRATAVCQSGQFSVGYAGVPCPAGDASPPPNATPFACGPATCAPTEYCINPCCGGGPPICLDPDDAGTCPAGSSMGSCGSRGAGCVYPPCKPPPPYCAAAPKDGCFAGDNPRVLVCVCG